MATNMEVQSSQLTKVGNGQHDTHCYNNTARVFIVSDASMGQKRLYLFIRLKSHLPELNWFIRFPFR